MDLYKWRGNALSNDIIVRGTLKVANRQPMDCFVIHSSDTSARIASADSPVMGDRATLIIPPRNISRPCSVVQRGKDDTFGPVFTEIAANWPATGEQLLFSSR